jgi:hypothetical protein
VVAFSLVILEDYLMFLVNQTYLKFKVGNKVVFHKRWLYDLWTLDEDEWNNYVF